jgi:hypothetical protein
MKADFSFSADFVGQCPTVEYEGAINNKSRSRFNDLLCDIGGMLAGLANAILQDKSINLLTK